MYNYLQTVCGLRCSHEPLDDRQPSWFVHNEVRMKMFISIFLKALFNMTEKKFKVEN